MDPLLLLGLALWSVLLQVYVLYQVKKADPDLATELFDGVVFSSNWQHQKKAMKFLYNPFAWRGVVYKNIKVALVLNFCILIFFLSLVFLV